MSDDSDTDQDDKTYEPTPQKLEKARKQGDIAQSKELHGLALYIGVIAASLTSGPWMVNYIGEHLALFFENSHMILSMNNHAAFAAAFGDLLKHIFIGLLPITLLMVILPLISMIAQQSITFSTDKVIPKLSRISPMKGFKNKFGKNALVEFTKGLVKVGLVAIGVGYIAWPMLDGAPALIGLEYRALGILLGKIWIDVLIAVTFIAAVIGVFDFFWQKYSFMQRMMMSFQEIKDEMKESQGDPHFKGIRQEKGREIAMNQMLADVKEADVIIVNPTHYSVALKWDQSSKKAPICLAKGTDDIAFAIRARAKEHAIPIHSDPPLARTLHATIDIGEEIQEVHYKAVAAALRFASEYRKKQKHKIYSD